MFKENRFVYYDPPEGGPSGVEDQAIDAEGVDEQEVNPEEESVTPADAAARRAAVFEGDEPDVASEVSADDEEDGGEESPISSMADNVSEVFGGAMSSLNEVLEQVKTAIDELLASWGIELGVDEVDENLQLEVSIISENGETYILNPETDERVDVNVAFDENEDGKFDQAEIDAYVDFLTNSENATPEMRAKAELITEISQAQIRRASDTADGNTELNNVSDEEVARASRRPPDAPGKIGERIRDSPLYNLKYRASSQSGARVLTSGYPGSENSHNRNHALHDTYPDLSDRAVDILYAYSEYGVNHIFSLSHGGDTRQAVEELMTAGLLEAYGDIELDSGTLNTSEAHLTRRNMRVLAKAYRMFSSCDSDDTFLSHCTHGSHRAVFTMLSNYILENDCTREEAERANGVPHDFIDRYGFHTQLDEIQAHRDEILGMVG